MGKERKEEEIHIGEKERTISCMQVNKLMLLAISLPKGSGRSREKVPKGSGRSRERVLLCLLVVCMTRTRRCLSNHRSCITASRGFYARKKRRTVKVAKKRIPKEEFHAFHKGSGIHRLVLVGVLLKSVGLSLLATCFLP